MSINLALILTVLTVFSGVVVAINKFVWSKQQGPAAKASCRARYPG